MRNERGYTAHLSGDAVAFVTSLTRAKQRQVLDIADTLAAHPFHIGDYQTEDAAGRIIENLTSGGFRFVYWVDHAARDVRIVEISRA